MIYLHLLLYIVVFLLSIVFHELGHLLVLRYYNKKWPVVYYIDKNLEVGDDNDYDNLTAIEFNRVITGGIVLGLLPILYFSSILNMWLWFILCVSYYIGCRHDIRIYKKVLP